MPAVTHLTNDAGTTDLTAYETASVTFPGGTRAFAFIRNTVAASIPPTTVTTTGLTWSQHSTITTAGGGATLSLYSALVPQAGVTGTVLFDYGAVAQTGGSWEVGYISSFGAFGAAVAKTRSASTEIAAADDLPAFTDPTNSITLGYVCLAGSAAVITADAAWTTLQAPVTGASPNFSAHSAWRAVPDQHWAVAFGASSTYLFIGVEITPAGGGRRYHVYDRHHRKT